MYHTAVSADSWTSPESSSGLLSRLKASGHSIDGDPPIAIASHPRHPSRGSGIVRIGKALVRNLMVKSRELELAA